MRTGLFIGFALFIDFLQLMMGISAMMLWWLPFVGQAAFAYGVGLAEFIGFTLGAGLIVGLVMCGMFYPGAMLGGSLAEMVPLGDIFFPGWTLMTWRCVHNKKVEEKKKQKKEATITVAQAQTPRPVDGIRAANDQPYAQVAA